MFIDFDEIFNDDKNAETKVPQGLVDYLSSNLPKGVKYKSDGNGNCYVVPEGEGEPLKFGGFICDLSEQDKKILGKNYSFDDMLEYFYNAQKAVKLKLIKKGMILVNDKEIAIDKFIVNPLSPITIKDEQFFMFPPKFPKPFKIKIGDGVYWKEIEVQRIPNESINVATFESNKNAPIYIKYALDDKTHNMKASISYNLKYVNSVRDIVESLKIYLAFCEKRGYMFDNIVPIMNVPDLDNKVLSDSANFWEKVLKIEKALGIEFIPPKEDIDFATMCEVEFLYQCLINKNPIRDTEIITSINGKWDIYKEGELNDLKKPTYFELVVDSKFSLFGKTFSLPAMMSIFDSQVESYEKNGDIIEKLILCNADGKQRFTVVLLFKNEEELELFRDKDREKDFDRLYKAKRAKEYLL